MQCDSGDYKLEFLGSSPTGATGAATASPAEETDLLDAYSQAVTWVVEKIGPSVVNVHMRMKSRPVRGTAPQEAAGTASGVVITPDGYIVTNSYVVNNASEIEITLPEGT